MKKTKVISDGGKPVWFCPVEDPKGFIEAKARLTRDCRRWFWDEDSSPRCHLTGSALVPADGVYLVISNYELFPNCLISKKLADHVGLVETVRRLVYAWKTAQLHAHWFV